MRFSDLKIRILHQCKIHRLQVFQDTQNEFFFKLIFILTKK